MPVAESVYYRIRAEVSGSSSEDGSSTSTATKPAEKSEVDKLMEGISFGQLCNEFECVSSPAVEKTARQLVKDILYIKEGRRSLGNFSVFVKYKVFTKSCWRCLGISTTILLSVFLLHLLNADNLLRSLL